MFSKCFAEFCAKVRVSQGFQSSMPEQILLQGKILGTEEFLLAGPARGRSVRSAGGNLLRRQSRLITPLCEGLPRARCGELGLGRTSPWLRGGGHVPHVWPG